MPNPFKVKVSDLEDGSFTYDVMFTRDGETVEVATPINQPVAEATAGALNDVYRGFEHINKYGNGLDAAAFQMAIADALGRLLERLPSRTEVFDFADVHAARRCGG